MSQNLRRAKNANQRMKDLVNGYIRMKSQNINIPIVINYICLLHYLVKDRFGQHGKLLKLLSTTANSKDYDIVKGTKDYTTQWNSVYGMVDIDTNNLQNDIVYWKFKIESGHPMKIGIMSSEQNPETERLCFERSRRSHIKFYGWNGYFGHLYSHSSKTKCHPRFKKWDIIKMELNVKQQILKFYKNNKDINLKFENIDISETYRLTVSLNARINCKLRLIDSELN